MKIDIVTLFPKMFKGPFEESIIKRAHEKDLVNINIHDLRNWAADKHNTVDGRPYGGGPGMVLMVKPVDKAITELKRHTPRTKNDIRTILLSPQGKTFTQQKAKVLSKNKHIILIAGHYEGFDQRIRDHLIDEEVSIGDYVMTGGELPAMVIVDTIVRLVPGTLGDKESLKDETHSVKGYKKYPVYTRPKNYKGLKVPKILLSGHHAKIKKWRKSKSKQESKK